MQFFVPGIPKPGGSKKTFLNKYTGKINVTDACNTNKEWRQSVIGAILENRPDKKFSGAVMLSITFFMPRPKSDYKSGDPEKGLKPNAPVYHTKRPDCTKLIRSTEDAITDSGCVWYDDSQVAIQTGIKQYADKGTGALITIKDWSNHEKTFPRYS
jgi:Holliday junction resolvase RusA-like endonuclease